MTTPYFPENKVIHLNFCSLNPDAPPMSTYMQAEFKRTKLILGSALIFEPEVKIPWEEFNEHITELDWRWDIEAYAGRRLPIHDITLRNLTVLRMDCELFATYLLSLRRNGQNLMTFEIRSFVCAKHVSDILTWCNRLKFFRITNHNVTFSPNSWNTYFTDVLDSLRRFPLVKFFCPVPVNVNQTTLWKAVELKVGMDVFSMDLENTYRLELSTGSNYNEALALKMPNLKQIIVKYCDEHYLDAVIVHPSAEILFMQDDFNFSCTDCFSKFLQCFPNLKSLLITAKSFSAENFIEITTRLPRLQNLYLTATITNIQSFAPIFENSQLRNLESLFLKSATNLNAVDLIKLRRTSPKLNNLFCALLNLGDPIRDTVSLTLDLFPKMKHLRFRHLTEYKQEQQLLTEEDIISIFGEGRGRYLKFLWLPLRDKALIDVVRRELPTLFQIDTRFSRTAYGLSYFMQDIEVF